MATNYQYRILLAIPLARRNAVRTWYRNNIDSHENMDIGLVPAAGADDAAADYFWFNTALTNAQAKAVGLQLCSMASITVPDWDGSTKTQRINWFNSQRNAIFSATQIGVYAGANDGADWPNPEEALAALNRKRRRVLL